MVNNLNSNYNNFQNSGLQTKITPKFRFNPNFTALERTFVILKPDSFKRNLAKSIEKALNVNGLKIVKSWAGIAPREKLEGNYIQFKLKPFFDSWMRFLQSGKVKAIVIEADDAVGKTRALALKIREIFAPNEKRTNLIHSSDSVDAAKREIENFFGDEFNLK